MENFEVYSEQIMELAIEYTPKVLLALIVLVMGLSIIKSLKSFLQSTFEKAKMDPSLSPFIANLTDWGLKALLFISVASMVGVETTSFVAVLGAAGLAVGLALQGSLSNFAGGVLILIFRPFKVGDYLEAQGEQGVVDTIDVFATVITTLDNRKVVLPNGPLAGGSLKNYTAHPIRRVDLSIGVSYGDDVDQACQVLTQMCSSHPKVINEPAPFVGITDYGDSSINLTIRPWCKTEDYWDVFFELNAQIKKTLDQNQISIPFPQRDVHIFNEK